MALKVGDKIVLLQDVLGYFKAGDVAVISGFGWGSIRVNEGLKDVKESSEDDEGYETLDLNDEKPKLNFTTYTSDEFRELYTEDEIMFLDEVNNCADHSYKFFDYHDNELSFEEFDVLDDNEKLYCTVVRSDGTIVDSQDHQSERLWEGSYTRSHVS